MEGNAWQDDGFYGIQLFLWSQWGFTYHFQFEVYVFDSSVG
jgi:hypothetical protein